MAQLRVSLTLNSADVLSSALSLSVVSNIVCDSGTLSRVKVSGTSAGNTAYTVHVADQFDQRSYLYVKNLEAVIEDYIYIYDDSVAVDTSDSEDPASAFVAKIGGGEFAFIPVSSSTKYAVYATKSNSLMEFALFGNDNSGTNLTVAAD